MVSPASAQTATTPIKLNIASFLSANVFTGATNNGAAPKSVTASLTISQDGSGYAVGSGWSDVHLVVSSNATYTATASISTINRTGSPSNTLDAFAVFATALTGGTEVSTLNTQTKTGTTPKTWYVRVHPSTLQTVAANRTGTYTGTVAITCSMP
jgi:hypothetical protein